MNNASSPVRALVSRETDEPSMRLHRPSSARSQDVRHVLTKTFGDLFTKDAISVDTIKNLITTRDGEDEYHDRYVDSLHEVLNETESKLNEISMLEKHIMQAEAKAMSADERHARRAAEGLQDDLGLPVGSNHFRSCLDYNLLKKHHLLTPDTYANYEPPKVAKPQPPAVSTYLKETENFVNASKGKKEKRTMLENSRLPNRVDNSNGLPTLTMSKINQLNNTIDNEDAESVDYMKEGSDAGGLYDSIATYPSHPTKTSAKRGKKSTKKTWTEQLAVDAREQEKAALEKLQTRTNYLKNPRFDVSQAKLLTEPSKPPAKEINKKRLPVSKKPADQVHVFMAIPTVLTFTDYQVGQVYETTLELKNVSSSLRPVRVLPTSSSFFSVGLGQFPGEQGLVASGMSAQFKVRFMPDSLGEYCDEIHVQSQSADPLVVKVVAKRPPPVLTLPPAINVGECLVGGTKVGKFFVRNDGGAGKFCFISKQKWPVTNFKSSVNPAFLDMQPFQVRPAIFELGHKEATFIEIVYRPIELGASGCEVLMLCDNCHMKQFTITGKGQLAGVEFVAIDGGTSEKEVGELCDATAQKLIRFDDLNPFTYTQKTLILSNTTNVGLAFEWMVVKPHIVASEADNGENVEAEAVSRTLDVESPFSIEPRNGILEPSGIANFKLTFAPPEVGKYHSVMHLVLPGIPQQTEPDVKTAKAAESALLDITALEIECKADAVPLKVLIQPYAVYVNGKNLLGTTVRKQFSLINNSMSPASFHWESSSEDNILEVTPALGEVGPGMSADMEVSITGCKVGKMHEVVWCHVKNLAEPLALHVDFEVMGPEVYIDESDVNLGLVRFGNTATATVTLQNESQMPATFELRETLPANTTDERSEFVFEPSRGELRPLETRKVQVQFFPQACKTVRTFFELSVGNGGHSRIVAVRAEVQKPDVCLLSCNMIIPKMFVEQKTIQTVTLINKSLLATQYKWGEACEFHLEDGKQVPKDRNSGTSVDVACSEGTLEGRETLEVEVRIQASNIGDLSLILPCHVSGMDEPLLLYITAKVEGLQLAYAVQDAPDLPNFDESKADSSLIDFGTVCVKSTAHKYLYIRNKTPMTSHFSIEMKNFSSRPPTPPVNKHKTKHRGKGESMRGLLEKTPNIADPNSKSKERAFIELQQQLLKTDKGLAVVVSPASGQLSAYEEKVVDLSVYTDMWGAYEDVLTCHITDYGAYKIPVKVNVTGVPLQFHMAAVTKDPTLRFGTHASNATSITRTVRINNHGPVDTRVDWQMFNVAPNDEQLIDFVLSYGESFPKKDSEGNILCSSPIIPESPIMRPPTEQIPNTPDSTSAPSRIAMSQLDESSRPVTQGSILEEIASDVPLIQVVLRPHEGHEACKPFTVQPTQMVIPARDRGFINVTFNPESGDPMGEDCNSYVLGYLNVEDTEMVKEGHVSRAAGYAMEPMKLSLAGCIEPALLTNEFMDDEGLRFRGVASDLMRDGVTNPKTFYSIGNGTKLSNLTEALLSFKVDVSHPFIFTRSIPAAGGDDFITLKPNESSEIYVDFCISANQISLANDLPVEDEEVIGQKPVVLVRREQERQLHFTQCLTILFKSGASQELPLHASLIVPSLVATASTVDFGTCLVGQTKQKTFVIKNKTRSSSYWSCKLASSSRACQLDTFVVEPNSGILEAHIAHVTNSDALVTISFLARQEGSHQANFIISGVLGEEPITISASGNGSFDEKNCDLLNLVVDPATAK